MLQKNKKTAPGLIWRWGGTILTFIFVTLVIILIRELKGLQRFELFALDYFFIQRPIEEADSRIVLVGISETDIQNTLKYPIKDGDLAELIEKIKKQKPRVIGLDIYRDFPIPPGTEKLNQVFETTNNLMGVTRVVADEEGNIVPPPPILKRKNQVTGADVLVDPDGIIRRATFFSSPKNPIPGLGLALAMSYLAQEGIFHNPTERSCFISKITQKKECWLQLKDTVFFPFKRKDGGYVNGDDSGYQILINWRGPTGTFKRVTVTEVLSGEIPPSLFKDKVVLIGYAANSVPDKHLTPYSQETDTTPIQTFGIEIHANITSQILSNVLDGRPMLEVWSDHWEYIWIAFWIGAIAIWGGIWYKIENPLLLILIVSIPAVGAIYLIYHLSFMIFLSGWWIPVVPPILGVALAAVTIISSISVIKLIKNNRELENIVNERTQELTETNQQLDENNQKLQQTLEELRQTQEQLISKEKLAILGTFAGEIAHSVVSPLNKLILTINPTIEIEQKLEQVIEDKKEEWGDIIEDIFIDNEELLPELRSAIIGIRGETEEIVFLIEDLLSYLRQENTSPVDTDISIVLQKAGDYVSKKFQQTYPGNEIILKIEALKSLEKLEIVDSQIIRAVINLLDNACYAVIKQEQKQRQLGKAYVPTVTVKTQELTDSIEITIQDNGTGINPENLEKIFLPFKTTKPKGEGTGLGLFFTHEIITNLHQGEIKVESEPEKYTKFTIVLPKKFSLFPKNS